MAVLIAIGVDAEGYREILGVCEGTKEDAESWRMFLRHLKDRGLSGVKLFIPPTRPTTPLSLSSRPQNPLPTPPTPFFTPPHERLKTIS